MGYGINMSNCKKIRKCLIDYIYKQSMLDFQKEMKNLKTNENKKQLVV